MIHQPFVTVLLTILGIALFSFLWVWSGEKMREMDISDGDDLDEKMKVKKPKDIELLNLFQTESK